MTVRPWKRSRSPSIPSAIPLSGSTTSSSAIGRPERFATSTERLRSCDPVWRAFEVVSSLDSGDSNLHSAPVRVYDGEGRWRSTLHPGVDLTPANLAHDLREALNAT